MDNINLNLENFIMPIKLNYDNEYYSELKQRLNNYKDYIKNLNFLSKNTIDNIEHNINLIIGSVEDYYNANIADAKNKIFQLLDKYKSDNFIISELNKSFAFRSIVPFSDLLDEKKDVYINDYDKMNTYSLSFFRARIGNSAFEKKDMLHIPFCNRELVSTQRFSIPGVPCLYLGTTSYVCWLEMDKPQDSIFNVSSFIPPLDLKILNLVIDYRLVNKQLKVTIEINEDKKDYNINLLESMLEIFPLVYATSFTIKNKERRFKSEYIVSQLIMQCLSDLNIHGIAYASKKVVDSILAFPQCINLAIPMKINKKFKIQNESDNYADMCQNILLTNPVNFSEFIKMGGNNKTHTIGNWTPTFSYRLFGNGYFPESKIYLSGKEIYYKDTEFANFDNYIFALKHDKADIFISDR
nr:RES domain-containing protein [uncultured Intestinibacter sp.]